MSEIEQLREELARLRERVAVLEAGKQTWPSQVPATYPYTQPYWWVQPQQSIFPPGTIYCATGEAS